MWTSEPYQLYITSLPTHCCGGHYHNHLNYLELYNFRSRPRGRPSPAQAPANTRSRVPVRTRPARTGHEASLDCLCAIAAQVVCDAADYRLSSLHGLEEAVPELFAAL